MNREEKAPRTPFALERAYASRSPPNQALERSLSASARSSSANDCIGAGIIVDRL